MNQLVKNIAMKYVYRNKFENKDKPTTQIIHASLAQNLELAHSGCDVPVVFARKFGPSEHSTGHFSERLLFSVSLLFTEYIWAEATGLLQ